MEKSIFFTFFFMLVVILPSPSLVSCNGVFRVHHKFYGQQRSLSALKAHDTHRHHRMLAAIDIPLGGNGNPTTGTGLYYAKIGLGSPAKDFLVQVDTGSDVLWVNCVQCNTCKKKTDSGQEIAAYDPKASASGKAVNCDDDFCAAVFEREYPGCAPNKLCEYRVAYADGSSTEGYYVRDYIQYNQASGNDQTKPGNSSITFGCGVKQAGDAESASRDLSGIIGFGQSNSSVLSQLASSGTVKKVFSHCLDGQNGGGIFAIGQVVQPKVKSTPLVPNQSHYNVNLKEIVVGKDPLDLPTDVFETGDRKGTIIDSGTTLAYLPDVVYAPLMRKILGSQSNLKIQTVEDQFQCFKYSGSVDDGFPTVTMHFEDSLTLTVYPHEYMFNTQVDQETVWCIGWVNSGLQSKDGKDMTLLGDLVLSNKLVVYDLENQVIGWSEYNCSSSIKLLDEPSGSSYAVHTHDLSFACGLDMGRISILLLLSAVLHIIYF